MDGRSRYNKIKRILEPLIGHKIDLYKLKNRVMIEIGASESIVIETIRLMVELGLIIEVEHLVYEVLKNEADI